MRIFSRIWILSHLICKYSEWEFLPKSPFTGISKVRSSSIQSQNSCRWGPRIENPKYWKNPLEQMNFTLVRTDRWLDSTWCCYCLLPWHEIQYQYLNPHNSPESNPDPTESLPLSKSPVTREKNIEEKKKKNYPTPKNGHRYSCGWDRRPSIHEMMHTWHEPMRLSVGGGGPFAVVVWMLLYCKI